MLCDVKIEPVPPPLQTLFNLKMLPRCLGGMIAGSTYVEGVIFKSSVLICFVVT